MRKAGIATALGMAAVIALAGCAGSDAYAGAPLLVTGEGDGFYAQRNALVAEARGGADVSGQLAEVCEDWVGVEGEGHDYQWLLFCENPDYVWNADHNIWLSYEEATAYN